MPKIGQTHQKFHVVDIGVITVMWSHWSGAVVTLPFLMVLLVYINVEVVSSLFIDHPCIVITNCDTFVKEDGRKS